MLALEGKTALVTGGNSGIGFAAARVLSRAGAEVVLTSRSAVRAEAVANMLAQETGGKVTGYALDFTSLDSIGAFARTVSNRLGRLDRLINNAGAIFSYRQESSDGIEKTWAVNHLGPFALTAHLLPLLKETPGARIVTTASDAHLRGIIDFANLDLKHGYAAFPAYSRSKLGNVLFTLALARRLETYDITANCLHPGVVATNFFRFVPLAAPVLRILSRPFLRGPEKGAETLVYLATDDSVASKSGGYYFDKKPAETLPLARDILLQDRVWALSNTQTGVTWPFD